MRRTVFILFSLFAATTGPFGQKSPALFTHLTPKQTGIEFNNEINESEAMNVLAYEYFYNGGGVAAGDINNDGLPDIYLTANNKPNKLFLNKGNFNFSDITKRSGTTGRKDWKTGVTMADVNGDGWLDIYVCYSGRGSNINRRNELYINNRNLTFTESAKEYGLDDGGATTQAIFFDYDIDGDLDCYVLNHNIRAYKNVELKYLKDDYDSIAADKLYRNDDGKFNDVSKQAGITGNPISFGLGIAVSDINNDGWPDLYVSNDYTEQDYCLINNANGTFSHREMYMFSHLSQFSMGSDIADMNNDGLVDIYTLDMLPEDNRRQKLLQAQENYELYQDMSANGFHYQFMRNMLHLNNGNGTFSEIGQLAGISNTDWSWAPLFADFDNDGNKDLLVTNGYMRDYTNKDFMKYWGDYLVKQVANRDSIRYMDIISQMPSTMVTKYLFRNKGDLTFENVTTTWGVSKQSLSNGAAFADLDNDGDLDLVINNINENVTVLRNETDKRFNHYLQVKLFGTGKNVFGLGSKVYCYSNGIMQLVEQMPTRGYQSSVSEVIHFGLGNAGKADSLKIVWPDGAVQVIYNIAANSTVKLEQKNAAPVASQKVLNKKLFSYQKPAIDYTHLQVEYNDFKRQPLMPVMLSQCGPKFIVADLTGDGKEDVFFGSSESQPAMIYSFQNGGSFIKLENDTVSTTAAIAVFDVDGDKDLDVYEASGGYNYYTENDPRLQDRLLLNNGTGEFQLAVDALPSMLSSKGTVAAADIDADGDIDLFVGGRSIPGRYPVIPQSFLLENDGKGRFTDATSKWSATLAQAGMITTAKWIDVNNDGLPDLLVAGEWMTPLLYINRNGKLVEADLLPKQYGFWNTIELADLDNDGDEDIIAGNWGLNSQLHCNANEPLEMIYKDFDGNGSVDPFLCCYIQGKSYPYISRDELLDQIYPMRKKFTSYLHYAVATINDVFSMQELADAKRLHATHLSTTWFENENGKFVERSLPPEAQFSPVYKIIADDLDGDGFRDLLLLGNNDYPRLKIGKMDANFGTVLLNNGKKGFRKATFNESGLMLAGDVKDAGWITINNEKYLLIGINNSDLLQFKLNK